MPDPLAVLSRRLYARRIFAGLTMKELAESSGVSYSTISRIETGVGDGSVSVHTVQALADALICTPQWLLGWTGKNGGSNATVR